MKCDKVQLPGGVTAIVCGRGQKRHACHYCGNNAGFQCDHPVFRKNKKETCDTWMCESCRNNISENQDLCRPHFNFWRNNENKFVLGGEVIQ